MTAALTRRFATMGGEGSIHLESETAGATRVAHLADAVEELFAQVEDALTPFRDDSELSVIAVHLIPTLPFESWSADRGDVSSGSLVDIAHARHVQLQNLRAYVEKLHRPAVVCGDFNAPATSPAIHALDGVLEDAFRVRGEGFGWTAPTPLAQLRIDYVFVRGLDVVKIEVGSAATSDHYPLVADLVIR